MGKWKKDKKKKNDKKNEIGWILQISQFEKSDFEMIFKILWQ